jgi:hypothetical protein
LSKPSPPLLGFNNNVRHRGRVFHIQTEDSGVKRARLVTHLFADGGRILRTARTDYSEHLGRDDMVQLVRRLMKEQHKGMFVLLRSGELDEEIETACGAYPDEARSASAAQAPSPESGTAAPAAAASKQARGASEQPQAAAHLEQRKQSERPLARPQQPRLSNPALHKVVPSVPPPTNDFELDVAALDLHVPTASAPPDPRRAVALARTRPPPTAAKPGSVPTQPAGAERRPSDYPGRYAASRPAAIFGDIPSPQNSIFGQDMLSEQSLDEVILSYLADDLKGPTGE